MKFLLVAVNAKFIHSNPAIYSLRACAGEELCRFVELAEYTINQPMEEILADIYYRKPDGVGFSCYIWNWRLVQELIVELAKLLPDTAIWLGGPEVSYDADVILKKYPQLTGIMTGEGEATFREVLEYYTKAGCGRGDSAKKKQAEPVSLEHIKGLCLPGGYTPCRAPADMSAIPFLYEDLSPFANKIIYYESSRGCPFRCTYCLSSVENQVRFRNISIIKEELRFFLDHKVNQVKFVDRTFNCSHEHTMAIWQYIFENDNGVTNFHFEISADILRDEEIALLRRFRPGLAQLEIGVQSVNPDTLKAIRRVTDIDRLEAAVRKIRKGGNVHIHLDLIAGLPYEDYVSFGRSFDRVYRMGPHQLQLGFLKVLKGSGMWEAAEDYGIGYMEQPPYEVLYTGWMSYGELRRLKGVEEMVEFYYNSGQFTHTLPFLERAFEGPFVLYERLADFVRAKGYPLTGSARIRRYEALLAFAEAYDNTRQAIYRELLTYDLYLRENMKSRPAFAADLSCHQEAIRNFRRTWGEKAGKMVHLEPFYYPVWDPGQMAKNYALWGTQVHGREAEYILFDYQKRDPISHDAAAAPIGAWSDRGTV
ncbi:MAG: DUF4080 domain-containing protein [Lachnospiraceae bacterium]|jgi:radical SAM superfamily enzyme YgiQ (UPF0313 family)|nr:DUF4080 domain-containing protein [Lachnospiraceae bacterium]